MGNIKLYHGTPKLFYEVDLTHCKDRKDFGKGFYLTSSYTQAKEWAYITSDNNIAYINMYKVDTKLLNKLNTHKFNEASREWVKYIINNRIKLKDKYKDYDVVIGKVADARANILIRTYIDKYGYEKCIQDISIQDSLIKALKPERLEDQCCFKLSVADAIKLWYNSKTREYIRKSNKPDIALAYPTKCFGELVREIEHSDLWLKTPW